MNQSDFRALLSASSNSGASSGGGRSFGGKRDLTEADLAEVRRLSKKPKKKPTGGRKPDSGGANGEKEKGAAAASASSAYRDRAAERRKGGASDMVDAAAFAHLDAAQSKFLGGDLAHTHLVKGLDFALLAQLKREREALLKATTAAQKQKQKQQLPGGGDDAAQQQQQRQQQLAFKTRVGRLVYFHAVQSGGGAARAATQPTERFLPGRMYYTFDVSASAAASVPVVVQNSKEDCPEPDEVVSGMVSQLVISRVSHVLSSKHGHGVAKKLRRKKKLVEDGGSGKPVGETGDTGPASEVDSDGNVAGESERTSATGVAAAATTTQDDSDDEDIFPDAGEYVPVVARATEDAAEKEKTSSRTYGGSGGGAGYFSNLSAFISASKRTKK
ncbi:hypothetical protein PybrP1_007309 [[Pythium] brassicae (nom. inval.)]|nr:hypothetical protein PybrP1_007309 [[Pythium] brassicae (nom. inval.)]